MMRVVSLGMHILDILGAPVKHPPASPGRFLLDAVRLTAAGTAAGTSVDLAKLGVSVTAMGGVGDDEIGDLVVNKMAGHGVDTRHLVRKVGVGTSATILPIGVDGERFATFHRPGASGRLERSDVDIDLIADSDLVHIGGPDAMGDFGGEPLRDIVAHAHGHGVTVTMDVLSWCDEATFVRLRPALSHTDYFLPNAGQVSTMTGYQDPADGARALLDVGVGCVVVTLGPDGSLIMSADEEIRLPTLATVVVDTTGCGDAYTAGFIVGTLHGWDLRTRGLLGSVCASLVAQGLGSDAGIVDLETTLALLAEHATADALHGPPR
jgi:sugar/nucleoside kinase (ribokinase family)